MWRVKDVINPRKKRSVQIQFASIHLFWRMGDQKITYQSHMWGKDWPPPPSLIPHSKYRPRVFSAFSLRKITLNKQFIIIILTCIYLRVVQKVREQSCFGLFKWVLYQNGCHKIPNQIRVDLNIFHKIKLKLEWSRSRKVRMTQCENRPNFLIELFYLNIYSFTKTCRKTIMFNWNIVSCVRHLKPFSNE